MNELSCFVCGREFQEAMPNSRYTNQPSAGTTFSSHGHYGSTVWDPMSAPDTLEINICDPCLLERKERVYKVHERQPPSEFIYTKWEGLHESLEANVKER